MAPNSASSSTMARPIPRVPPVTSAVVPRRDHLELLPAIDGSEIFFSNGKEVGNYFKLKIYHPSPEDDDDDDKRSFVIGEKSSILIGLLL